jgi:hypothetical protein
MIKLHGRNAGPEFADKVVICEYSTFSAYVVGEKYKFVWNTEYDYASLMRLVDGVWVNTGWNGIDGRFRVIPDEEQLSFKFL